MRILDISVSVKNGRTEPEHDRTKKMTCAYQRLNKSWVFAQSDQSLICAFWISKNPNLLYADIKDSD